LDSELLGIVIELINIPVFMGYIFFQGFVDELDINLVPVSQYITDRSLEVKGLDLIPMR
jgi:hypothetical protein